MIDVFLFPSVATFHLEAYNTRKVEPGDPNLVAPLAFSLQHRADGLNENRSHDVNILFFDPDFLVDGSQILQVFLHCRVIGE